MWTQVLLTSSSSIFFPQHDPPTHKCLLHNLTLGCAREYFWVAHVLAPFSPTPTSSNTTLTLSTLHLKSNGYFLFFFEISSLTKTSNFLLIPSSWHSNACHIYQQVVLLKWFLNTFGTIFTLKIQWVDSFNYFNFFFILHRPHPPQITHILGVPSLLAMTKPSGGVRPIIVGKYVFNFMKFL